MTLFDQLGTNMGEAAGPKPAASASVANFSFTVNIFSSQVLKKSVEKVGGASMGPVIQSAINEFLSEKLKKVVEAEAQGVAYHLNAPALDLGKNDRGLIGGYDHYHLKVGEKTGLFVLFYKQVIDTKSRVLSLYLAKVVLHTDYRTSRQKKDLPKTLDKLGYDVPITVKKSEPPAKPAGSKPLKELFTWLKRLH